MSEYRVIIADDHLMFRAGLRSLIAPQSNLRIVGEAGDGLELLEMLKKTKCDLVVMDLSMPRMDGMEALEKIGSMNSAAKVLVLTMQKDTEHFQKAIEKGACGYVLKEDAFDQFISAIETIQKGERFFSPSIMKLRSEELSTFEEQRKGKTPEITVLTHREQQILKLIASGLANKNIATQLNISTRTVEAHRSNLTKKLGLRSTAALVRYAVEKAFI
ncbi:MAG TPA: response regulator transcription factor [Candidatus Omnitrophota bacterium]|nr:response regulator transcription factor [Candidatus Omnitrophota bacterium]